MNRIPIRKKRGESRKSYRNGRMPSDCAGNDPFLAESRSHPIAIDDERAIRRAKKRNPNFETLGTLEILILWQERNGTADDRMGQLLQSIFRFARFRPAASHLRAVERMAHELGGLKSAWQKTRCRSILGVVIFVSSRGGLSCGSLSLRERRLVRGGGDGRGRRR